MKHSKLKFLFTTLIILTSYFNLYSQCEMLVWEDDFSKSKIDTNKWEHQIGDGQLYGSNAGWGASNIQYYTDDTTNSRIKEGNLEIVAKKEMWYKSSGYHYTSARLRTNGKFDFTYGRVEARIKVPWTGRGVWPAFWMIPSDGGIYGSWPRSGEIDIMEVFGPNHTRVHQAIHYGNHWTGPDKRSKSKQTDISPSEWNWNYHLYAMEWTPTAIKFYLDDVLIDTYEKSAIEAEGYLWPFDNDFYLILQTAISGDSEVTLYKPGTPDLWSDFIDRVMKIDYVRVYQNVGDVQIKGKSKVYQTEELISYSLPEASASSWNWSVPSGAEIVSGQNTNEITVKFKNASSGNVSVNINNTCGSNTITKAVEVIPYQCSNVLLNYDNKEFIEPRFITNSSSTGTYTHDANNPKTNTINSSSKCGKYIRNTNNEYDKLHFKNELITNASEFATGTKLIKLDIYSNAPIGTPIEIALANSKLSRANYPSGIKSTLRAVTTKQNEWERLTFTVSKTPFNEIKDSEIDQLLILFDPRSNNGHTYYIDNIKTVCNNDPIPNFKVNNISPDLNESITFEDVSLQSPNSYTWDFGADASPQTANGIGPHSVKYSTSGHKTITMNVDNGIIETKENMVYVHAEPETCEVLFEDFDDGITTDDGENNISISTEENNGKWIINSKVPGEWAGFKYNMPNKLNFSENDPILEFRARASDTVDVKLTLQDENGVQVKHKWIENLRTLTTEWQVFQIDFTNHMWNQDESLDRANINAVSSGINAGYSSWPYENEFGQTINQFNGKIEFDYLRIVGCAPTATDKNNNEDLIVSPNPSNGKFHLSKDTKWVILNSFGHKLIEGEGNSIDLSSYSPGVYLLQSNGVTKKIIKY